MSELIEVLYRIQEKYKDNPDMTVTCESLIENEKNESLEQSTFYMDTLPKLIEKYNEKILLKISVDEFNRRYKYQDVKEQNVYLENDDLIRKGVTFKARSEILKQKLAEITEARAYIQHIIKNIIIKPLHLWVSHTDLSLMKQIGFAQFFVRHGLLMDVGYELKNPWTPTIKSQNTPDSTLGPKTTVTSSKSVEQSSLKPDISSETHSSVADTSSGKLFDNTFEAIPA